MRYALYLSANPSHRDPDDDYFCVLNSIEDLEGQVHEFRSWDPEDQIEELSDLQKGALLVGDRVTLKGLVTAICIRPIGDR